MAEKVIDELLSSSEPSVRWKVRTQVLAESEDSRPVRRLTEEIRGSARARALLSGVRRTHPPTYAKWQGAHWVLAALAELGYPVGDPALTSLGNEVLDTWLAEAYYREFEADTKEAAYRKRGVPVMNGRHRRCASQQGNALLFLTRLGLVADRADALVERLLHWQWPDGGWNCDKRPSAASSSVFETVLPARGIAVHARMTGDGLADASARKAAEVLLERRLIFHRSTGAVIHPDFTRLQMPLYWHYDVLGALRAMVDVGVIDDSRCGDGLDILESKRLADGGWPCEKRRYTASGEIGLHHDFVDWGGVHKSRMNPWVTAEALAVLTAAGRISP